MSDQPQTAYKVLTAGEMEMLQHEGRFGGSPVDLADGYIHLSTSAELDATVAKHFGGQTNLYIVAIDLGSFSESLKWEVSRGGQLFPHLYGSLLLETVVAYGPLEQDGDGKIKLPVAG